MDFSGLGLIDTHAHLNDPAFSDDLPEVMARAAKNGVSGVICVSETMHDARICLSLARLHPGIFPAAGLYPVHLDPAQAEEMVSFIRANKKSLVAIGEVGLDFWEAQLEEDREVQEKIFSDFIKLSIETNLPLNVHSRSAGRHVVAMLLENGATNVQLHAFDGKYSAAQAAVEAGYYFSIPPSIIRSRQKQKIVKHLPLSHLLVETDSPVLGPSPESRNEPANALIVVDAIATIKGVRFEEVVEYVRENTERLYGRLKAEGSKLKVQS